MSFNGDILRSQVDARSYLLDFKCIDESQLESETAMGRLRSNNMSVCLDACSGSKFRPYFFLMFLFIGGIKQ